LSGITQKTKLILKSAAFDLKMQHWFLKVKHGEHRYVTLGQLAKRVVVIVHTQRGDKIRIISLRKANEREKKIYNERLKKS
jgi:uncharacterized DUF497 family protein